MESARWERIQELFHAAADLPAAEQRGYLASRCGPDEGLMADVLALVAEDARGISPIDRGVAGAAHELIAAPPPLIAQQLGPYRIKQLLGEGGMGVVYLAERLDIGSLVAIKVLGDAWLSPARLERFTAEQKTLAQLDHPAIARLYDAGALDDGTPYFVMEYVEGKPLTVHCRDCEAALEERLRLFRSLCEAVQFAHRHAIIHRDIKPSNVLVRHDGSVRLLDFGIAKHLEHLDSTATQTMTGLRLMTPAYAAPERFTGGRVGIYTDVYSLGVVLYELLTSRLPFDRSSMSPAEAFGILAEHGPDRPSAAAGPPDGAIASRSEWADLDVLVLTAMHRDPQRRYASVDALIRDIDHYLGGEPLDARPDSVAYRLGKFVARHRSGVVFGAATLLLVVGLLAFFTARLASARDEAQAEAARTQRIRDFMEEMLTGGDQSVGPAKDLRVVQLLDNGVKQAEGLDQDPEVQADMFQTLGSLYQRMGESATGERLLRSALERHRALHGEESGTTLDTTVMLGLLCDEQSRYDEAEQLLRRALDVGRRALPTGDPRAMRAAIALGRVLSHQGRHGEAVALLQETIRLQTERHAPELEIATSRTILANAYYELGRYAEADAINRRSLEYDRRTLGDHHPGVATDLYNLGSIAQLRGHHAEAEKLLREAVSITERFYGRDHYEMGSGLTLLGRSLVPQGKLVEAEQLLREALAINNRAYGEVHPRIALSEGELGHLALAQGRVDDAEAHFRRQQEIYRQVFDGPHYFHDLVLINLAGVSLARNDHTGAERLFREALNRYRRTRPPEHPSTAILRVRLAGVLVLERRFAEAEEHALAGYEILAKTLPDIKWLTAARSDLATIYDALGQPDKAARFRAELAAAGHRAN